MGHSVSSAVKDKMKKAATGRHLPSRALVLHLFGARTCYPEHAERIEQIEHPELFIHLEIEHKRNPSGSGPSFRYGSQSGMLTRASDAQPRESPSDVFTLMRIQFSGAVSASA